MKWLKRKYWKWQGRRAYYARERLFDSYDCGASVIDYITGGKYTRLSDRIKFCVDKMKELEKLETLKS